MKEKPMAKTKIRLGILVIVLLFGITVYGYTDDPRLHGTWVFEDTKMKDTFSSSFKELFITLLKQMSGGIISPDDMKAVESALEDMSDAELKQLIEISIEASKSMLRDSAVTFNNGNVENTMLGMLASRGTYTTGNGKMTTFISHYNGEVFGLDDKMYSRAELLEVFKAGYGMEIPMPESETVDYAIIGNKLSLTNDFATSTYTRKR
jgi:hypothetical protein